MRRYALCDIYVNEIGELSVNEGGKIKKEADGQIP